MITRKNTKLEKKGQISKASENLDPENKDKNRTEIIEEVADKSSDANEIE